MCRYVPLEVSERNHLRGSGSSSIARLQKSPSVRPFGSRQSNILELRLMHHYTKMTCGWQHPRKMASIGPTLSYSAWEVEIPQMAFTSDVVLRALLAISARNLLSLNPRDKVLAEASSYYFGKAVAKHLATIGQIEGQIDCEDAEALLLTASMIIHYNWLSSHSLESQAQYSLDLKTYSLCQGTELMYQKLALRISKYEFTRAIDVKIDQGDVLHDMMFMDSVSQDMKTLLNTLDDRNMDQNKKDVYERVAEDIIAAYYYVARESIDQSALEQRVVTFFHRVPPPFIRLLGENDPISIALYARNIALLSMIENSPAWWIHGVGEDSVCRRAISSLYLLLPLSFHWIMEWPSKILSKEVRVSRHGAHV
jgi:hypothetical protein